MVKRYLHDALRSCPLERRRFYSVDEMVDLLISSDVVPSSVTLRALKINVKGFAQRNIPEEFSLVDSDSRRYLGAAWLFPVRHTFPNHLDDLREELNQAERHSGTAPCLPVLVSGGGFPEKSRPSAKASFFPVRKPMAIAVLAMSVLLMGWGTTASLQLIRTSPKRVIDQAADKTRLSYKEQYYLAEAHLGAGNLEAAERIAYDLLKSRAIPTFLEGHSNYLLAKINLQRGQYEAAFGQAELAKVSYQNADGDTSGNIRGVEMLLVSILIQKEQYQEAMVQITSYFEQETNESYRSYLALMASDVSFWLTDYEKAMEWSNEALTGYQRVGDRMGQANAQMNRAWLHAVLGETDAATFDLQKAEGLLQQTGGNLMLPHINLTRALLSKCTGKPVALTTFRRSQDPSFIRYVEFVDSFSCEPERIIVHNPPPQGDPPPKKPKGQGTLSVEDDTNPSGAHATGGSHTE